MVLAGVSCAALRFLATDLIRALRNTPLLTDECRPDGGTHPRHHYKWPAFRLRGLLLFGDASASMQVANRWLRRTAETVVIVVAVVAVELGMKLPLTAARVWMAGLSYAPIKPIFFLAR